MTANLLLTMLKLEMLRDIAQLRHLNVQHLQRSQREAVRHRREARRVDSWERIDQSAQLDRVSRVCISTIQRFYSMLRCFFFWIETLSRMANSREETGGALSALHETRHRVE